MKNILRLISLILLMAFSFICNGKAASACNINFHCTGNVTHTGYVPQNLSMDILSQSSIPTNNFENPTPPESFEIGDSLVLFAGNDTTVCLSGFYIEVSGVAQNFYYASWATAGDGFFAQATQLNTQYFPGPQDKITGIANIYLVGICLMPEYVRIVDSLKISLVQTPECFAGLDDFVCEGDPYQMMADASSFDELFWSTGGDGTFDQADILNPVYFHGDDDLLNGQVSLELVAFAREPCILPDVNQMTLYIVEQPLLSVGNDTTLCEGQSVQLNAEIENGNGVFWTSDGDGTFSENTIPDPVYHPGPLDIETGGCVLSAYVAPVYPCEPGPEDELSLEIVSYPDVNIGGDQTICENEVLICGATVENYESLQWTVLGGDGYFEDSSQMCTVYHPGEHEKSTGVFYVLLSVTANDPCSFQMSAFFKVELVNHAKIYGGADQLICSTDSANLFSLGENYESVFWQTNGDGTFLGDGQLSRKYIPGVQDIQNGSAEIFICAASFLPCDLLVCDTVHLYFQEPAEIFAGYDATICEEVPLNGVAEHTTQVSWITSGDGSFDNQSMVSTVYHAGQSDTENLTVTLTLMAESLSPCEMTVSDDVLLTIDRPVLEFENVPDQELFVGESVSLHLQVASLGEIYYQWYHDGEVIAGQTAPELNLTDCQPADAGQYYCRYWNDCFVCSGDTALINVFSESTQTIPFSDGWNAISSYVLPASSEIELVLSPIIDDLVILYSDDGMFYPGQDIQTFYNWSANEGYFLKSTSANNFTVSGYIKYPQEGVVLPPGWSLLPVTQECPVSPDLLFGNNPLITAIKEVAGFRMYWPEKGIFTLQDINPGKAYEVFNASDEAVTLTFPGCDN